MLAARRFISGAEGKEWFPGALRSHQAKRRGVGGGRDLVKPRVCDYDTNKRQYAPPLPPPRVVYIKPGEEEEKKRQDNNMQECGLVRLPDKPWPWPCVLQGREATMDMVSTWSGQKWDEQEQENAGRWAESAHSLPRHAQFFFLFLQTCLCLLSRKDWARG